MIIIILLNLFLSVITITRVKGSSTCTTCSEVKSLFLSSFVRNYLDQVFPFDKQYFKTGLIRLLYKNGLKMSSKNGVFLYLDKFEGMAVARLWVLWLRLLREPGGFHHDVERWHSTGLRGLTVGLLFLPNRLDDLLQALRKLSRTWSHHWPVLCDEHNHPPPPALTIMCRGTREGAVLELSVRLVCIKT